jgi:hypothetical protein
MSGAKEGPPAGGRRGHDRRLIIDVARLYAFGGPEALACLLAELGCRRMVRTEIDILLAQYILTSGPAEGSA